MCLIIKRLSISLILSVLVFNIISVYASHNNVHIQNSVDIQKDKMR